MSSFQGAGAEKPEKPSLLKRALAFLILALVVVIAVRILFNIIAAVFWIIVGVAAVIAVLWALKTLL